VYFIKHVCVQETLEQRRDLIRQQDKQYEESCRLIVRRYVHADIYNMHVYSAFCE